MKTIMTVAALVVAVTIPEANACDECGRCRRAITAVAVENDSVRVARLLTGSIEPRLPTTRELLDWTPNNSSRHAERFGGDIVFVELRSGTVRLNHPPEWVHDVPVTWESFRESHLNSYRIERAAIVWTETWRNRLE